MSLENIQYINSSFGDKNELLYRVSRAGSSEVSPDFIIKRNSSYPYCVIHYVAKGSGEIVYRGEKYFVDNGQCFILNCFEGHCYRTDPNDTLELNWIEFSGGDSAKLIGSFLNASVPVIKGLQSRIINKYIMRILVYLKNNSRNSEILISKTIYTIMMHLMFECEREAFGDLPESKMSDIQKIINYVEHNLDTSLSVEQLAKVLNYNPQYFIRLFQKHMGITPAKYIMRRRISKAKKLLSTGDIQIDILAEQLGFCNSSHFIKKFKKAEGLTPAQFRNESLAYYK